MEITNTQRKKISNIAKSNNLELVLLFGSLVGRKTHAESDLDIAVKGRKDLSFTQFCCLHSKLQDVFPECEVDLSFIRHADPLFLKKMTETCQLLYGDERKLRELKIFAYRRYQDHRRYFDMERAYADRFIKEFASHS